MQTRLQCGRFSLPLMRRPLVMGILNATPDSFSDGGHYNQPDRAWAHAEAMIADGVDMIDIGGESSRPGAQPLSLQEELDRVMPLVEGLRECGVPLSIDTYKPALMREAIAASIDMVNDISGFRGEGAWDAVADADCALCIMHMQGEPKSMQQHPEYDDVVVEVSEFLAGRLALAQEKHIARERLCVDPGFGFGKTLAHNIALFRQIDHMQHQLQVPLLVGVSRKTMIGELTGRAIQERMAGSVAAALAAASHGARIVRVHDVRATVDALKVWEALHPPTLTNTTW